MRLSWGTALVVACVLGTAVRPVASDPGAADAGLVAMADAEARGATDDLAGGLTLVMRSSLTAGGIKLVPRGDLLSAIQAGAGKSGVASLVQAGTILKATGARALMLTQVERVGVNLRVTVRIVDRDGRKLADLAEMAPAAKLSELAEKVAAGCSRVLGGKAVKLADTSVGQLRPFVRAAEALEAGQAAEAVKRLEAADSVTAGRFIAASEIAETVWKDESLPVESRLRALLVANPPRAREEAEKRIAKAPKAPNAELWAIKADAQLASLDTDGAAESLAKTGNSKQPAVLLARARLADQKSDHGARDAALTPLLAGEPYLPALSFISTLPANSLSPEQEAQVLLAAETIKTSYPRLAAALALRAGTKESVHLLDADEFSHDEQAALERLLERKELDGIADTFRVRAQLRSAEGHLADAEKLLNQAKTLDPQSPAVQVALGRVETSLGNKDAAAQAYQLAVQGGDEVAKQEYARALLEQGNAAAALQIIGEQADNADGLLIRGRALLVKGDGKGALALLKQAELLAPNSAEIQMALAEALKQTGQNAEAKNAELRAKLLALNLTPLAAPVEATAVQLQAAPVSLDPQTEEVHEQVEALLAAFPILKDRAGAHAAILPLQGSGVPLTVPRKLTTAPVLEALTFHLRSPRWKLNLVPAATEGEIGEPLNATALGSLAGVSKVEFLILYKVTADGEQAKIRLFVFENGKPVVFEQGRTVNGIATGLVSWDLRYLLFPLLLLMFAVAGLVFVILRGTGSVVVKIARDLATEQETYHLLINKQGTRPVILDPVAFTQDARLRGHVVGRRKAFAVSKTTSFEHIPSGDWFLHLYGTFKKGGTLFLLEDVKHTREIQVRRNQQTTVEFNLVPDTTEIHVTVYEGDAPQPKAKVWIDEDDKHALLTDRFGRTTLHVQLGSRLVSIMVGDFQTTKEVTVTDTKARHLTINLTRERKMAEISGGLSLQVQEQGATMTADGTPVPKAPRSTRSSMVAPGVASGVAQGTMAFGTTQASLGQTHASGPTTGERVLAGLRRYQQTKLLGQGAMGVVYRAQDLVLEREVAVKIMSDQIQHHPDALRLFQREAKALAKLNHSNIVAVYDQGVDNGQTFMVMEFVDGHSLEDEIVKARPSVGRALDIIDQLCQGLNYAHDRNIIHRDIKPANIFISKDGVVKIGDFGLAHVTRDVQAKATAVRGTPSYMAPEQIIGGEIDNRADIYAVGCTLFELLVGVPPFTDGDVLYHHVHTEPPRLSLRAPGLPKELDIVFFSCVNKKPQQRYKNAQEVREALKSIRQRYG